jgi:hypothetical protein
MDPIVVAQQLHELARRMREQVSYVAVHAEVIGMQMDLYSWRSQARQKLVLFWIATVVAYMEAYIVRVVLDDRREVADVAAHIWPPSIGGQEQIESHELM